MLPQLNSAQNVMLPRMLGVLNNNAQLLQESRARASRKSTLELWLRGDSLEGNNGDAITLWRDISGRPGNRDATPGTSPILTRDAANGQSAATFDGVISNRFLAGSLGSISSQVTETWTIFTVSRMAVASQIGGVLDTSTVAGTTNTGILITQNLGAREMRFGGALGANVTTYTFGSTAVMLHVGRYTTLAGSSGQLFEKDVSKDSDSSGITLGTLTQYRVGRLFGNVFPFNGDIFEVGLYSSALSTTEIFQLSAYAVRRYSIA